MSELKKKITETDISEELLDSAHVLVTQEEQQADGTSIESLRRVPLAKFPASKPGQDGGYYTPSVTQPDANTMEVSYTPSWEGMPDVTPVRIALPKGMSGSGLSIADDGAGNVTISSFGAVSITDDGEGNVTIQ